MFEGIYFQFPKLGFLLFFFLACEALCPLRSNPLYFPHPLRFGESGVKPPLWLWVAKWAMIVLFIIALMSPVREHEPAAEGGSDILLVLDPSSARPDTLGGIDAFVSAHSGDRIALWVPGEEEVIVPLTREHDVLRSILPQLSPPPSDAKVTRSITRFFTTSADKKRWVVILTDRSASFVHSLPEGMERSVVSPDSNDSWPVEIGSHRPPVLPVLAPRYYDYYYIYPLFMGFMAMLAYLYGRNQKGLK